MVAEHNTDISNVREQLQQYILQIEDLAALQERNRIARDIHDSLGNALTTLNIQLQTALKLWHLDPAQAQEFLAEAHRLGAIAIKEVRQSVSNIRESELSEKSPEELIDALVENFHASTGITPSTKINLPKLPIKVATTIYRIVQESLTNICKYAEATEVKIELEAAADSLHLTVQDNGKGFNMSQKRAGFGLQGMHERVAAINGTVQIESEPGCGCKITVEIPLLQVSTQEDKKPEVEEIRLPAPEKVKVEVEEVVPSLALSPEHHKRLENILLQLIGPVAPTLLVQVIASACTVEEFIDKLALHLTIHQQMELRKQTIFLFEKPRVQPEVVSHNLPTPEPQDLSESFIGQCEENLAIVIGPIASFLVQKAMKSHPGISRSQLVNILAHEISDPQTALNFKMRLLS